MRFSAVFSALLVSAVSLMAAVVSGEFSSDDKQAMLAAHNRIREIADPPAAAMLYMTWSQALEDKAQLEANKCLLKPPTWPIDKLSYRIAGQRAPQPWQVVTRWYLQRRGHQTAGQCLADGVCDEYLLLMTDKIAQVGCAHKQCGFEHYVYCAYSAGLAPYVTGEPCSACPVEQPRCLNGLCVSAELADRREVKLWYDVTASAKNTVCKLDNCQDCGRTLNQARDCQCSCMNGGRPASGSTARSCRCECAAGHFGSRCRVPRATRDSSVELILSTKLVKPVSLSLFKTSVWPVLQRAIAEALRDYCNDSADRFEFCCDGKTRYAEAADKSLASPIQASRVYHSQDMLVSHPDGSLSAFAHAKVSLNASRLCRGSHANDAQRAKRGAGTDEEDDSFVPPQVMHDAILAQRDGINAKLRACCEDVSLRTVHQLGISMSLSPSVARPTLCLVLASVAWSRMLVQH